MEALFIIPALVSESVNERIVPALCKIVERNVVLNNSALFKKAVMIKYSRAKKFKENADTISGKPVYVLSETTINENTTSFDRVGFLTESQDEYAKWLKDASDVYNNLIIQKKNEPDPNKKAELEKQKQDILKQTLDIKKTEFEEKKANSPRYTSEELQKLDDEMLLTYAKTKKELYSSKEIKKKMRNLDQEYEAIKKKEIEGRKAISGEENWKYSNTFSDVKSIETPKGFTFFNQISLEPTILEIPVTVGRAGGETNTFAVRIGIKCVAYKLDGVKNLVYMLNQAKNMTGFESLFRRVVRKIKIWLPYTKWRYTYKGKRFEPREGRFSIVYGPNKEALTNPVKLARKLDIKEDSNWSTLLILSSFDFKNNDVRDFVKSYKKMTQSYIGDLIITNETKESAFYCIVRTAHCQELGFEYIKKVMNLDGIIDYTTISRSSSPWRKETKSRKTTFSSAIK